LVKKNGTVQWSAWMTHTRLHPPTIEVLLRLLFPFRRSYLTSDLLLFLKGITSRRSASATRASQRGFDRG
jgi:hypothetical protein